MSMPAGRLTSTPTKPLRKAKVLAARCERRVQCLPQLLIALIFRQIQLIEARVTARQAFGGSIVAMDVEPREAVHAFELLEAVERHLGRARDELEQLGPFFLVEGAHGAPEPLDLR